MFEWFDGQQGEGQGETDVQNDDSEGTDDVTDDSARPVGDYWRNIVHPSFERPKSTLISY